MTSSIRCDSRDAQAVPPPSSISMRSAVARPAATRSLRMRRTAARTLAPDPSPLCASVRAARSRRNAAPSITSSSFRGILAICAGWSRFMGGVYSANWAGWVWAALPSRAALRKGKVGMRQPWEQFWSGRNGGYRRSIERDARLLGKPIDQESAGSVGLAFHRGVPGIVLVRRHFAERRFRRHPQADENSGVPGDRFMVRPIGSRRTAARACSCRIGRASSTCPMRWRHGCSHRSPVETRRWRRPSSRSRCCLLLPALASFRRIVAGLGFERPEAAFFLALMPATRTLFEFAPGRIDYHNVQDRLSAGGDRADAHAQRPRVDGQRSDHRTGAGNQPEFAYVLRPGDGDPRGRVRQRRRRQAARRLGAFGAALAMTALLAYAIIVGARQLRPGRLRQLFATASAGAGACRRRRSSPRPASGAGSRRLIVRALGRQRFLASPRWRCWRFCFRNAWAAPMPASTPMCAMSFSATSSRSAASLHGRISCSRATWSAATDPVHRRHRAGVIAIADRFRDRNLLIVALFALLALAQSVLYFRYFRYVPILAAPGLILVPSALAPGLRAKGALLAGRFSNVLPSPTAIARTGSAHCGRARRVPSGRAGSARESLAAGSLRRKLRPRHASATIPGRRAPG